MSIMHGDDLNLYVPSILFIRCFDTIIPRNDRERSGLRYLKLIYFFKENFNNTYLQIIVFFCVAIVLFTIIYAPWWTDLIMICKLDSSIFVTQYCHLVWRTFLFFWSLVFQYNTAMPRKITSLSKAKGAGHSHYFPGVFNVHFL